MIRMCKRIDLENFTLDETLNKVRVISVREGKMYRFNNLTDVFLFLAYESVRHKKELTAFLLAIPNKEGRLSILFIVYDIAENATMTNTPFATDRLLKYSFKIAEILTKHHYKNIYILPFHTHLCFGIPSKEDVLALNRFYNLFNRISSRYFLPICGSNIELVMGVNFELNGLIVTAYDISGKYRIIKNIPADQDYSE